MKRNTFALALLFVASIATASGCRGGEPPGLSSDPPTEVTRIADSGFVRPMDAVPSVDGSEFYFTAYTQPASPDEESLPAVFRVDANGGAPEILHAGAPLSYPTGLVLGPKGENVFIADQRVAIDEDADEDIVEGNPQGAIYAVPVTGGAPTALATSGIGVPSGLALSVDGSTLYVSGWAPDLTAAVFTLPVGGGTAQTLYAGAPLRSPTGIHVDKDNVAWVMDHMIGELGTTGGLYAIDTDGNITTIIDGLRLGVPAGVSLTAGGGVAVIPNRDDDDQTRLTAITLADGAVENIEAGAIGDPAGLRTARGATVFAIVDSENNAIYRGQ